MLVRIKQRFHIRAVEWLCSIGMIAIGLYLLAFPNAFMRTGLAGFEAIAPIKVWIAACIVLGMARIGALVLNGHQPEVSAPIRCFVACLGVGLFASIAAAYSLATNEHGPPLAMVFAVLFTLADLYSAARSGIDTMHALEGKRWIGFTH